jgi:hypothetical protein
LFFQALQQTLKIKTFVGISANAVRTQVWTAPIAMLVLQYLQLKSKFSWSLSTLAALLRQPLFFYCDLWAWQDDPFQAPPAHQLLDRLRIEPAAYFDPPARSPLPASRRSDLSCAHPFTSAPTLPPEQMGCSDAYAGSSRLDAEKEPTPLTILPFAKSFGFPKSSLPSYRVVWSLYQSFPYPHVRLMFPLLSRDIY